MLLQIGLQTVFRVGAWQMGGHVFQLIFLHWNTPIIMCVATLIAGIAGVINWKRPKRSEVCASIGGIIILIYCINFLYQVFVWRGFNTVSLIEITIFVVYIASTYMFQEKKKEQDISDIGISDTLNAEIDVNASMKGRIKNAI
jgi:uncharacterized membrane protein